MNFIGHTPEESMITSNYKDYYGSRDYSNSHFSWWPYGIWGHYSNIPSEAVCAFKCLTNRVESCSYYFWGNGHCQVGHYNHRGHNLYGDYGGSTKYMVRNDLSKKFRKGLTERSEIREKSTILESCTVCCKG